MNYHEQADHYWTLEKQVMEAQKILAGHRQQFNEFKAEVSAVKVSDIVLLREGVEALVVRVDLSWVVPTHDGKFNDPAVYVTKRRLNGEWSKSVQCASRYTLTGRRQPEVADG